MVSALHYALDARQRVNWTEAQEKSLTSDYPFDVNQENDEQYVVRIYLQFLWFPEVGAYKHYLSEMHAYSVDYSQ